LWPNQKNMHLLEWTVTLFIIIIYIIIYIYRMWI
jgi:hypothetical protein